jgi:hypothetical protein
MGWPHTSGAPVCNLGNFLRMLATPQPIKHWTLTRLKAKLLNSRRSRNLREPSISTDCISNTKNTITWQKLFPPWPMPVERRRQQRGRATVLGRRALRANYSRAASSSRARAIALPDNSPLKMPVDRALIKITASPEWKSCRSAPLRRKVSLRKRLRSAKLLTKRQSKK